MRSINFGLLLCQRIIFFASNSFLPKKRSIMSSRALYKTGALSCLAKVPQFLLQNLMNRLSISLIVRAILALLTISVIPSSPVSLTSFGIGILILETSIWIPRSRAFSRLFLICALQSSISWSSSIDSLSSSGKLIVRVVITMALTPNSSLSSFERKSSTENSSSVLVFQYFSSVLNSTVLKSEPRRLRVLRSYWYTEGSMILFSPSRIFA